MIEWWWLPIGLVTGFYSGMVLLAVLTINARNRSNGQRLPVTDGEPFRERRAR